AWYGWRSWVEQSFKVLKRGGWQVAADADDRAGAGRAALGGAGVSDAVAAGGGRGGRGGRRRRDGAGLAGGPAAAARDLPARSGVAAGRPARRHPAGRPVRPRAVAGARGRAGPPAHRGIDGTRYLPLKAHTGGGRMTSPPGNP